MACNGLKKGLLHMFVHPKWSRIILGQHTFLTHFGPISCPKTAKFPGILGFSKGQNGPPRAQNAPKTLVLAFHVFQDDF